MVVYRITGRLKLRVILLVRGQHIDVSLVDCIFTCLENNVPAYTICQKTYQKTGQSPTRMVHHMTSIPVKMVYVCVVASNEKCGEHVQFNGCAGNGQGPEI